MTNEALKIALINWNTALVFEEGGEWLNVLVPADQWKPLAKALRTLPEFNCNYLFCLTCVDWKTHLTMVYHLTSLQWQHNLVIKSVLNRDNPEIETVSDIWKAADFLEREVYELFGVNFINHPDLRRLILTDDFNGWPLRKDFEDSVNMIRL
ncbi:MAG: NADH-quinone oxidoreductase subunit C [Sphingobacteriales bacterium]|uniref:NADH-quinone oxidoreductase subunit C n=1 Tax=Hydrotalea flava TaxID=714549 RepID=UPI000832AD86|nr:NADH-quinone oxidoreductase subunit C [Hydrotalea flava]RTL51522.1 MAG: NADH-quinone oxidoreductase subunit C [Sphingobacteriales bacterium]